MDFVIPGWIPATKIEPPTRNGAAARKSSRYAPSHPPYGNMLYDTSHDRQRRGQPVHLRHKNHEHDGTRKLTQVSRQVFAV